MTACDGNKILSAGSLTRGESKNHWLPLWPNWRSSPTTFPECKHGKKSSLQPGHHLFDLLHSGRGCRSLKTGTSFCPSAFYTGKTQEIDPCETVCAVAVFSYYSQRRNHLLHLCKRSSEHHNRIRRAHFGFCFQKCLTYEKPDQDWPTASHCHDAAPELWSRYFRGPWTTKK